MDRAQIPALRRFADVEPNGAFGRFVENERDISWLADRGSLQRQGRPLEFGGRRRLGVWRRWRRRWRWGRTTRGRKERPFARGGKRVDGNSRQGIALRRR